MFAVYALFALLLPLAGLLLKEKIAAPARAETAPTTGRRAGFSGSFYLLLLAVLAVQIASFIGTLGRSLAMNDLGFSAAAISSTGAIAGAVILPLPLLLGRLSDRVGRKQLLLPFYVTSVAGLLILAVSSSLWHFWVAVALHVILSPVNQSVGPAWVTDFVPRESLGRGLSLFSSMSWVGGIIGFAGTGLAIQNLGMTTTLIIAACLPLIGAGLLMSIRQVRREKEPAAQPAD